MKLFLALITVTICLCAGCARKPNDTTLHHGTGLYHGTISFTISETYPFHEGFELAMIRVDDDDTAVLRVPYQIRHIRVATGDQIVYPEFPNMDLRVKCIDRIQQCVELEFPTSWTKWPPDPPSNQDMYVRHRLTWQCEGYRLWIGDTVRIDILEPVIIDGERTIECTLDREGNITLTPDTTIAALYCTRRELAQTVRNYLIDHEIMRDPTVTVSLIRPDPAAAMVPPPSIDEHAPLPVTPQELIDELIPDTGREDSG